MFVDPSRHIRGQAPVTEAFLQEKGDFLQWVVLIPAFEQSGYVGQQEIVRAQPVPLDHVNELVEVEDFGLEALPEEDGVPVGNGFVGDRFSVAPYFLQLAPVVREKGLKIGQMDRLCLLQQLAR